MLLRDPDLAQRVVWILEALYGDISVADDAAAERVLERLGSGTPEQWGKFQCARDLPALLRAHGQSVCLEGEPACAGCELRKFCGTYRAGQQESWRQDQDSPTVVDLFCGAGGASLGFTQAGFKVLLAVDVDRRALSTFRLNHPELPQEHVLEQDLSVLDDDGQREAFRAGVLALLGDHRVDVVVGGPPCQGFSLIGTSGRESTRALGGGDGIPDPGQESEFKYDPKNRLYRYFLMMVEWLQPAFCVMENVPNLLSIGSGRVRKQIIQDFMAMGYEVNVSDQAYNCVEYGVPQERRRAIFLATRIPFGHPDVKQQPTVNLGDAIRDLPPLQAATGHEVMRRTTSPNSPYAAKMATMTSLIHNHVARPHQESDLRLYSLMAPGTTLRDYPQLLADDTLVKYSNLDRFRDIYKRQSYEKPSSTVIAHLSKDGNMYIHPDPAQTRTYTVREAARVQSFPDDYIFCGARTPQFRQVGNAIPPLFMRRFADLIATLLGHRHTEGFDRVQLRLF